MRDLFATVGWQIEDVQSLAPRMTDDEARAWLLKNEKYIAERLIELGWDVIQTFLRMDGIDMSEPDDEPSSCECDSTHQANDTVCRWCWERGRRHWDDPEIEEKAK